MNTVRTQPIGCPAARGSQRGFTMVELMVALLLGLVLIGSVINVFLTSGQTLRLNQNLSRVHENARFGVEMFRVPKDTSIICFDKKYLRLLAPKTYRGRPVFFPDANHCLIFS
jgi:prepilin-type N-terminal cleavage/methylation domain-containing protein